MKKSVRFGSSRGISTVVGTIFFVLTVFVIATSVFLYTMTQNALYNQAVKESRQMDADRFSERVTASRVSFTLLPPDTVLVNVTISNEGPISAQIITIWVVWTDGDLKKYGSENGLDIGLNPGDTVSRTIPVTDDKLRGAQSNGTFSGWLVTARGNLVSLEKEKVEKVVVAQVAEGIGSIQMDFDNFRYFYCNKTGFLLPDDGIKNTTISLTGEDIVFAVFLSNFDEDGRDITLDSRSLFWIYSSASSSRAAADIVTVVDGKATKGYYDPESGRLLYSHSKWIYFGPIPRSAFQGFRPPESCGVNLLLLGTIDSQDYGQNIPFVSIYVV